MKDFTDLCTNGFVIFFCLKILNAAGCQNNRGIAIISNSDIISIAFDMGKFYTG